MNRTPGFKSADGTVGVEAPVYYYGPYMPNAQPATAQPVKTPTQTPAPGTKDKNGWLSTEQKGQLFSSGLNLATQFIQTKIGGGQGVVEPPAPSKDEKTGSNTLLWVAGSLVVVTAVGLLIYKFSK